MTNPQITEKQALDFRKLAEALANLPIPKKTQKDMNPSGKRVTPEMALSHSLGTIYVLDRNALVRMSEKSGYAVSAIEAAYHHWWATWRGWTVNLIKNQGPEYKPIPWDMGIWVLCYHVEKGFDPPWVDEQFDWALKDYQRDVSVQKLKNQYLDEFQLSLPRLAQAYYQIFLAQYYPQLADPAVQIAPFSPVEVQKPEENGPREKRDLEIKPLVSTGTWRGRKSL